MASNKVTPRPYQRATLEALRTEYEKGNTRLAAVLATGLGKTTGVAANLPQTFPDLARNKGGEGGILFLVNRIDIARQAKAKFEAMFPDAWIGLEQGENHASGHEDMVFASVDSIGRMESDRIYKFTRRKFGIVISDEAHNLTEAGVWDNCLTYFGVGSDKRTHYKLSDGRRPLHVMLTATPDPKMAAFVDKCDTATGYAAYYDILYGIRNGWLVDIRARKAVPRLPQGVAFDELEQEEQVDYLMRVYDEHAEGTRTLVFARSVEQSRLLAESLTRTGRVPAGSIDAETPDDDRARILSAFASGELGVLSNRFVLTEGYDCPGIQTIIDNGPTSSVTKHPQKVGRGLRTSPDAQIDLYPGEDQVAERKAAIAASSKDALSYITTFDPREENALSLVQVLWDGADDADTDPDQLLVEEHVDVIVRLQEEHPEREIRDAKSVKDVEIQLAKFDVWSLTIENPKLDTTSPLRWVLTQTDTGERTASLYVPRNPRASCARERTPVVWHFHETAPESKLFRFFEVGVGGWVEELGHPVKAWRIPGQTTGQLTRAIRSMDEYLREASPDAFTELKRGASEPASAKSKRYLKNHGVKGFGPDVTEETARILIDDYRIREKMSKMMDDLRTEASQHHQDPVDAS